MYDWMHCYLVTGIFQIEMGLLLPLLYAARHSADTLLRFIMLIQWLSEFAIEGQRDDSTFPKEDLSGGI